MDDLLPRQLEDPYAYLIITDDGVDQVCSTRKEADREVAWLTETGDRPMLVVVPWLDQEEYVDYYNARVEEAEWAR